MLVAGCFLTVGLGRVSMLIVMPLAAAIGVFSRGGTGCDPRRSRVYLRCALARRFRRHALGDAGDAAPGGGCEGLDDAVAIHPALCHRAGRAGSERADREPDRLARRWPSGALVALLAVCAPAAVLAGGLPACGSASRTRLGAPIWKNKLFFFVAYEGFRLRTSGTFNRTILTPSARSGIFTWRDTTPTSAGGPVIRTANIFTLAAGLSNGPPTGIDPVIQTRILANLPTVGNNPALGDGLNTTGLTLPITQNTDREAFSSRFDWDLNEKHSFSGVYTYKREINDRTDLLAQQGGTACCYVRTPFGFQDAHTPFLSVSWRSDPYRFAY